MELARRLLRPFRRLLKSPLGGLDNPTQAYHRFFPDLIHLSAAAQDDNDIVPSALLLERWLFFCFFIPPAIRPTGPTGVEMPRERVSLQP